MSNPNPSFDPENVLPDDGSEDNRLELAKEEMETDDDSDEVAEAQSKAESRRLEEPENFGGGGGWI